MTWTSLNIFHVSCSRFHYGGTSPPLIVGDIVIVGSSVGDDLIDPDDPPGDVQAFDAQDRSSSLDISHHTPSGGARCRVMARRERTAVRAMSTSGRLCPRMRSAVWCTSRSVAVSNDYYGGARKGENLFAESIVCLEARTGRRAGTIRSYITDLWDYDLASAPLLATIRPFGEPVDVVVVLTKTGYTFVFDRVTGRPVWPIEERPCRRATCPGEEASPTQPFP